MTVLLARIIESPSHLHSSERAVAVYFGQDRDDLTLAGQLVLPLEEAEDVVAILDGCDRHVITFERNGWFVKHPLKCRVNLLLCDASGHDMDRYPVEDGVYELNRDAKGYWRVGEKI